MAKKLYSVTQTKNDWVIKITKDEFFDDEGIRCTARISGNGLILVESDDTGMEEYTPEQFIDMADTEEFTRKELLFIDNEKVEKNTDKAGNVTSIEVGCATINKDEALELMKKLGWIK